MLDGPLMTTEQWTAANSAGIPTASADKYADLEKWSIAAVADELNLVIDDIAQQIASVWRSIR
jgi:hypothetical protein